MVGCARTGSTLLRHVLNRSPLVSLASETHFIAWARRERLDERLAAARTTRAEADLVAVAARLHRPEFWAWVPRNLTRDELVAMLRESDLTPRSIFAALLRVYAERRGGIARGQGVLGEKTPEHLNDVPILEQWFPDARFIHTFRDPRAIYVSELRRRRQGRWGPKARLSWLPGWVLDPWLAPLQVVRTTVSWRRAATLHRAYERRLGPRYRLVRFEDLTTDPERVIRSVCDFIGVPFEAGMLDGVDVVGSSFHDRRHTGEGFDPAAARRWRTEIGSLAHRWFSVVLGRDLSRFGYPS